LAARIQTLAPSLVPWLPLLAAAAGGRAAETPATRRLDPAFRAQRLHEVVIELLKRLDGGLVIVVDDIQWADQASIALIGALARVAAGAGWLVACLRRPEGWSLSAAVEASVLLELAPLEAGEARALVIAAAGERGIADDALGEIVAKAAGHPLFLLQLERALESGQTDLPADVERMTAARLDRLDPRDRLLVQQASVAGRDVDVGLLADATGDAQLIEPSRWRPVREFLAVESGTARFRHDLYRESAYGRLPVGRRAVLHRRLGDALVRRSTPRKQRAIAPLLATHFSRGGQSRQAWRFARLAARAAETRAAWAETEQMCDIAIGAGTRLREEASEIVRLRLRRADAFMYLGRLAEGLDALTGARPADQGLRLEVELMRARLLQRSGRLPAALAATSRALDAAEAIGRRQAEVLMRRASILHQQGRFHRALRLAERALSVSMTSRERALANLQIAMTGGALGHPGSGVAAREAARLLRGRRHRVDYGNLLSNLGVVAYRVGRWRESSTLFARAGELFAAAGDSTGVAMIANNMAETLFQQGRLEEASSRLAQARRVFAAAGDVYVLALCRVLEGSIAAQAGAVDRAERILTSARGELARLGASEYVLDVDLRIVEVLLWRGRAGEALARARDCEHRATRLRVEGMYTRWARRLEAGALYQLGSHGEARALADELVADARTSEALADLALCLLTVEAIAERGGAPVDDAALRERARLVEELDFATLPRLPLAPIGAAPAPG
jgi:tetratricopeptide (TPR) repeat protein